jgi:hypothetical protein
MQRRPSFSPYSLQWNFRLAWPLRAMHISIAIIKSGGVLERTLIRRRMGRIILSVISYGR